MLKLQQKNQAVIIGCMTPIHAMMIEHFLKFLNGLTTGEIHRNHHSKISVLEMNTLYKSCV